MYQHYDFDRRLKLHILEAIEILEVSIRSTWSNTLSLETHDPLSYLNKSLFTEDTFFQHPEAMKLLKKEAVRSNEQFVKHFAQRDEEMPLWAIAQIMSIGSLSRWVSHSPKHIVKKLAHIYELPSEKNLSSFLHALTPLRNLAAHHSRVWDKTFPITIQIPKKNFSYHFEPTEQKKIYNLLVILAFFTSKITGTHHWTQKLTQEIISEPTDVVPLMGFPDTWKSLEPWSLTSKEDYITTS